MGIRARTVALLVAGAALAACKKVEPAPADLDGLAHWFWANYDGAEPIDVIDATGNLWLAVDGDALGDDPIDGSLTDLAVEELANIEIEEGTDPTRAAGVFFARSLDCPLDKVEQIVTALNQDELYEGVYDAYAREYTTDADAYFARETDRLAWDVQIEGKLLGTDYTEDIKGGVRYTSPDAIEDVDLDLVFGDVLLARTYMPHPAVLDSDSRSFDQDYQMEVFVGRGDQRTVHFYAIWRETSMGSGVDQDDDAVMRIILNNLADWDDGTVEICAGM